MKMKILAFDVSKKNTGYCFRDKIGFQVGSFDFISLEQYLSKLSCTIHLFKPDIVTYSDTVFMARGHSVKSLHFLMCLVELACQKEEVQVNPISDSQAKALVLGNGGKKKADTYLWATEIAKNEDIKEIDGDIADAMLFSEYIWKSLQKNKTCIIRL